MDTTSLLASGAYVLVAVAYDGVLNGFSPGARQPPATYDPREYSGPRPCRHDGQLMTPTELFSARQERGRGRAIVLMAAATVAFTGMGACMKLLRESDVSTSQVIFWRFAPGVPVALWVVRQRGLTPRLRRPGIIAARCAFGLAAATGSFYAVRALSLVQHSTLHLLQPVFVALLAPLVLGERLRPRATVALALACMGALGVLEPRATDFQTNAWPIGAALAAALCSAAAHMSVRKATRTDAPEVIVLYFAVASSVFGLVWSVVTGEFILPSTSMSPGAATLSVLAMATLGLAGQYLMTHAYAHGQAPVVAMIAYLAIPIGYCLDVALWQRSASLVAVIGGVSMMVAGAVLYRDHRPAPV